MKFFPERRHPRFDFARFPWVFTIALGESAPSDRPLRLEGKNISLGGLKFLSNRRFELSSNLQITLFQRADGQTLAELSGKVVRLEEIHTALGEKTFGIAVEFSATGNLQNILPSSEEPAK